jgi:hypothetical protein
MNTPSTKKCSYCSHVLPVTEFSADNNRKDRLSLACRACKAIRAAKYREVNKEKVKAWKAASYQANKEKAAAWKKAYSETNREKILASQKRYREENREKVSAMMKAWRDANPEAVCEKEAKRRAAKLKATPTWADGDAIAAIYAKAAEMRRSGLDVHVDHEVPLRSPFVCGLHVEHNLRVRPAAENLSKSNLYWPDMPDLQQARMAFVFSSQMRER